MRHYQKDIILDGDDLNVLKEVWKHGPQARIGRTDNLFYTKRLDISADFLDIPPTHIAKGGTIIREDLRVQFQSVLGKISSIATTNITSIFFVEYQRESFATIHKDVTGSKTSVTLVDTTDDLVGGEALVQIPGGRPRGFEDAPSYLQGKLVKTANRSFGIEVVPMQVGETLMYGPRLLHGVGRVKSGRRLVFIVWFGHEKK